MLRAYIIVGLKIKCKCVKFETIHSVDYSQEIHQQ